MALVIAPMKRPPSTALDIARATWFVVVCIWNWAYRAAFRTKIVTLLLTSDTKLLRFWFAISSLSYGLWVAVDQSYALHHHVAASIPQLLQAALFAVHGLSVMYGVGTGRFSRPLLCSEGLLGLALWGGIGLAEMAQQGVPGPMLLGGGGIALFLLVRYPTHYSRPCNADA